MRKSIIFLLIISIVALFVISGCAKTEVGQRIGSTDNKKLFVLDPKDITIETDVGNFKIVSAKGPNGEICNVDLISVKEIIEKKGGVFEPDMTILLQGNSYFDPVLERYIVNCSGDCTSVLCCKIVLS